MPDSTSINLLNYGFQARAYKELMIVILNHPEIDYSISDKFPIASSYLTSNRKS